jgi:hypothetical protein
MRAFLAPPGCRAVVQRAGHDLLAGYMLGSLAAFEADNGDPATGLRLAGQARLQLGNPSHPTPRPD